MRYVVFNDVLCRVGKRGVVKMQTYSVTLAIV